MRRNKHSTNACRACGHTWAPRGHAVSSSCPRCGSTKVTVPAQLGCIGCLAVLAAMMVLVSVAKCVAVVDQHRAESAGILSLVAAGGAALVFARRGMRRRAAAEAEAQVIAAGERDVEEKRRQLAADEDKRQARLARLVSQFGEDGAERIITRKLWVGAPADAVYEMFGAPAAIAEAVKGTHTKVVMKYFPQARGRFDLKVTVDDGRVSGWEKGSG